MMSAPSIVIGAFVYAIVVMPMGHFSAWAGAIALGIIMIPVILRTTDDMLQLRTGRIARSSICHWVRPKIQSDFERCLSRSESWDFDRCITGIARVVEKRPPLLFTSFNDNFFTTNLMKQCRPLRSRCSTMQPVPTKIGSSWDGQQLLSSQCLF